MYRLNEQSGERVLNSHVAHIHARSEGGPRWDPSMREDDNRAPANLLLLCFPHAWEIDNLVDLYPADLLQEWKKQQIATADHAHATVAMSSADLEAALAPVDLEACIKALAAVVPFHAGLRTEVQAWQHAIRKAMGWRMARLKPMVAPEDRETVMTWMAATELPTVAVPPGQVRVLTGAMGAGKTDQAIRWWEEGLQEAISTGTAEIGAFFTPRNAIVMLESAVIAELGHEPTRPCRIVIDDLDSVSRRDASRLLAEARVLVHTWPNVSVLATARHDAVALADEERIVADPWPVDRGFSLLRAVLGQDFYWPHWNSETLDLLTSPLTTLGLVRRLKAGRHTKISRSGLLAELASMAVEHSQREITDETWQDLGHLAVAILDRAAPVPADSFASPPRVRALLSTDLVVREDGTLRFALPVFEQYFGSAAIRAGLVAMERTASKDAFPLWRYALAFAVSTAEPPRQEELLLSLARLNPTAVFWIIDEIGQEEGTAPHQAPETSMIEALIAKRDCTGMPAEATLPLRAGLWLREAEEALMEGLGLLGERLRRRGGKLTQWGVQLEHGSVALARARLRESPPVIELSEMHPEIGLATGWDSWTVFPFPTTAFGRWTLAQKHFQPRLSTLIQRRTLDTPLDSMLAKERAYYLARFVTDWGIPHQRTPINLHELRTRLADWVERANTSEWSTWQSEVDSADVWWLDAYLARETGDVLQRPWPVGDQPHVGRWFWETYSKALTETLARDIIVEAINGYRHLVETNFPQFGDALGLYGMLPLHIEGFIDRPEPGSQIPSVQATLMLHRLAGARKDAESTITMAFVGEDGTPDPWDRGAEHYRRATPARFEPSPVQPVTLPLHTARPATNLAYQWLAADLAALRWLDQTIDHFD
ncbi:hypothetical protein GCM10010170_070030 [Dactylosporangium salmoneum]|uniref:Uncharacterized protein n=1 Tax=Dactylosporangium salmoneum TaxID=53361 RepID=A0ABN3H5A4_9ACTN